MMVEKSKDSAVHFLKVAPWFVQELVLAMSERDFILLRKVIGIILAVPSMRLIPSLLFHRIQVSQSVLRGISRDSNDRGGTDVNIFRFENGRIAELWDVGQPMPEESPNQYGMF